MVRSSKKTLSNTEVKDPLSTSSSSAVSVKTRKRTRRDNLSSLAKCNNSQVTEKNTNGMKGGNEGMGGKKNKNSSGRKGGGKPVHVRRTIGSFLDKNQSSETSEDSETSEISESR
eukprot:530638-Rhodomonas_salina.1